jgi:hypothetical protein
MNCRSCCADTELIKPFVDAAPSNDIAAANTTASASPVYYFLVSRYNIDPLAGI